MNTGFGDVTQVIQAFIPTRKAARKMQGVRCGMCGLGITAEDFAFVEMEMVEGMRTTHPIHRQCTSLLFELQEELLDAPAEDPVV